jgi:hypothetical protein
MKAKLFGLAAAAIAFLNPPKSDADVLPLSGYTFTSFAVPGQQPGGSTHAEGINDNGDIVGVSTGPGGVFIQWWDFHHSQFSRNHGLDSPLRN